MIVGTYFDGDNDDVLKWQQHDRYKESLAIFAYGCIRHYKNAAVMRGEDNSDVAAKFDKLNQGFDHRALQAAHDYMAAWWRWKEVRHDPYLEGMEPVSVEDWLDWLRQEVETWPTNAPIIVDNVVRVLLNQNTEAGYEAEDQIQVELKNYYRGMPEKAIQVKEPLEAEKSWSDYEDEMREHQRQQEEARRQRYAERGIIGKIGLFISEHWQSEKDAWQSQRQNHKGLEKEDYRQMFLGLGGAVLLLFFVVVFTIAITAFASIFDFNFYVGHGDEAQARVALSAIMVSGASLCFFVYVIFFYFKNLNKHSDEIRMETMSGIRSCLLASLYCLLYAALSVFIDWITGNYLYRGTEANSFFQIILMGVYTVTAFFVFYLWARATNFGPFSRR